jgi:proline iminopeptidase
LTAIGPPPYARTLDYETALSYEHEVYPYDHSANSEGEGGFSENFFVEEYTLVEQVHLLGAFIDSFSAVYPQIQNIDFRRDLTSVAVPVFFAQGAHEAAGRTEPFEEWYAELDAPSKDVEVFSTSGHRPLFEQPEEFVAYMVDVVLSRTSS